MELPCMTQQQRDILGAIIEKGVSELEDKMEDDYINPLLAMWSGQKRFLEELGQAVDLAPECEIPKSDMEWEMDRYGNVTLTLKGKSLYLQGDAATTFLVEQGRVPEHVNPGDSDFVSEHDWYNYEEMME